MFQFSWCGSLYRVLFPAAGLWKGVKSVESGVNKIWGCSIRNFWRGHANNLRYTHSHYTESGPGSRESYSTERHRLDALNASTGWAMSSLTLYSLHWQFLLEPSLLPTNIKYNNLYCVLVNLTTVIFIGMD